MDERSSRNDEQSCPACQGGILRLRFQTHFVWLSTEMITVPDFPVWVCDLCGYRHSDVRAVRWLGTLLSPNLGKTVSRRRRKRETSPGRASRQTP